MIFSGPLLPSEMVRSIFVVLMRCIAFESNPDPLSAILRVCHIFSLWSTTAVEIVSRSPNVQDGDLLENQEHYHGVPASE